MKWLPCLAWLSLLLLAAAPGFAQTGDRIYRLGILSPVEPETARRVMFPELARLGYAEGRNLEVHVRVAPPDGLRDAVRDIIARRPDVILAISEAVVRAAHNETKTIPIVMVGDDPVRLGLARSHARPGGNVTGVSLLPGELDAKRLHLLVEDTEDNRQIVRDLLTSVGYEMIEAADGAEGVAAAAREKPDLILMDIQLPVLDGYEATRRIKANEATRHIPVIAVTSYALSGDEGKARAAGCDDYLAKPFSPRQLLAMVRARLG
ncbi:ABC transporter substrate binding protein [Vineibacter terrae]